MKKYLLDTCVVLWIAENSPLISQKARQILCKDDLKYVSIASAWEAAIKISKGKLGLTGGLAEFYGIIDYNELEILPVKKEYLSHLTDMPFIHKDPFDRLLVSTAIADNLTIITSDENIQKYDVEWVW
ncbi:MAG: type II toxin-antitoxin system VapC family toxin [Oscillospiraceae bacterium]|nr:type II toxin-antitoxin system VapC family toxin [Oscillospiraceae bacterium]